MTVPEGERRNIMENNENKKTPEELPDEALDKVAGGGGHISTTPQWVAAFVRNNCYSCRHYKNYETDCPYGTPLDAVSELGSAPQCPSKEA